MPTDPTGNPSAAFPKEIDGWDLPTLLHEVATPLQAALGLTESKAGGLAAEECLLVATLLSLVRDLCHSAAARAPAEAPLAPWDHVGSVVRGLCVSHPGRVIGLVGDDASRRTHRFDRLALAQTASNWVLNALRHAPDSEVRVRLRIDAAKGELRLQVEDDGEGLRAEDRQRIFARGWRGERARIRDPGGQGLGLLVVRRLAAAAGGRVSVGPSASGGCRFTLVLPARPWAPTPAPDPLVSAVGAKVAVIDDDPTSSAVAVLGLRAEGTSAETLRPGRGLARRILEGPWETLLLDRDLGTSDGNRLVATLRAAGWPGGIVLWTGDGQPPPPGADQCLRKPASRREIVDAVATAVAAAQDRCAARRVLRAELAEGARRIAAAAEDPRRLGPLAHRLAGALGLAGYPAAARRAQAVERACGRGEGAGPWRKLIGDLRALAKRAGWRDAEDQGPALH